MGPEVFSLKAGIVCASFVGFGCDLGPVVYLFVAYDASVSWDPV